MRRPRRALAVTRARVLLMGGVAVTTAALGLQGAVPAAGLPSECSQTGATVTCTYTSGTNPFTVPAGVSSLHVVAIGGAGGGASYGLTGGYGARVEGDVPVTGGTTVYAVVGGNGDTFGHAGANGGGMGAPGTGGGASDIRTAKTDLTTRLLVAGGGGGTGDSNYTGTHAGGVGGDAGQPGAAGESGGCPSSEICEPGGGGGGGTQSAGGAGGTAGASTGGTRDYTGCPGNDGTLGVGGDGGIGESNSCGPGSVIGESGGGGGGGYYGGGGGGTGGIDNTDTGQYAAGNGGGGGGSSLVPSGGSVSIDSTAVPEIVVSYTSPLVVSPSALAFGNQPLGSTSAAKAVTVSNNGGAPLAVTSVSVTGANAGDFSLSSDGCSGQSVAAGGSCEVDVVFAPTATGGRSATLNFADAAFDSPQTVALSGTGTTLADVGVTIGGPTTALSGSQQTYVVTVGNAGPSKALNVIMTTQVPSGTRFVAVSTTQGTCTNPSSGATSGTIRCSLGDLASGGSSIDTLSLKMTLTSKGGSVAVVANASSTATNSTAATPDPNAGNNVASRTTTITKK